MKGEPDSRSSTTPNVIRPGTVFLVVFLAAVFLNGDVAGSFADPDSQFVSIYADASNRATYVGGAFLLALAGLSFAWFAYALSSEARSFRVPLLITGGAAGIGMIVAAQDGSCRRQGASGGLLALADRRLLLVLPVHSGFGEAVPQQRDYRRWHTTGGNHDELPGLPRRDREEDQQDP